MDFKPVKPDLVKYEMQMVKGQDPFEKNQKQPGGFGRFLSSVGRFLGAVAAPFSLIFPPAMIGALGMYGVGQIGDQVQAKAYTRASQQAAKPQTISFPGLDWGAVNGPQAALTPMQSEVMNVLYARNDMMLEQVQQMKG